ncbi:divalent cation tolerance protein CutA [Escherichia coli]|nr:divalent cation tolerance protein CutA [Escherichia coli]
MLDEKSSNAASVVVLCTAPDEATAQDLAAKALAEKLAACATLIPGATSLYYWEGKLEQEYEVQMIFKTTVSHQQSLLECLKSHHPYQTPELLVLPVTLGDTDYLSWLNASLR